MIVALLNQKGGSGKTTLAVHIAGELAMRGARVLLIDADPQASALDWAEQRAREGGKRLFGVVGLARETLHHEVPTLVRAVDHVVIDGPPRVTALARSAMLASDLVLVPVQPSAFDVWASQAMLDLVRSVIARDVRAAIDDLHIPALDAGLAQRVAFAETAGAGRLAAELPHGAAAAREVAAVVDELQRAIPR